LFTFFKLSKEFEGIIRANTSVGIDF